MTPEELHKAVAMELVRHATIPHLSFSDQATLLLRVVREAMREPSRDMWTEINAADDKAYAGGSQHGAGFEMLWAVAMAASPLAEPKP